MQKRLKLSQESVQNFKRFREKTEKGLSRTPNHQNAHSIPLLLPLFYFPDNNSQAIFSQQL